MPLPNKKQSQDIAHLLKTLAHPQRLLILCHLSDGPKNVTELQELCGGSQSAVSQFLGRMKNEGLVDSKRYARSIFYEIADVRVLKLIQTLGKIYCPTGPVKNC